MAVEIIDGSVKPTEPIRTKRKYSLFDRVVIHAAGGQERVLAKVSAAGEVADAIRRGGTGRFFLSDFGGQKGIHGVRLDDGTNAYAHYNNVELMILIGVGAGVFMLLIGLSGAEGFMITPVVIGAIMALFYWFVRAHRVAGKQQYDSNAQRA